jgi:hypothetical protein
VSVIKKLNEKFYAPCHSTFAWICSRWERIRRSVRPPDVYILDLDAHRRDSKSAIAGEPKNHLGIGHHLPAVHWIVDLLFCGTVGVMVALK